VESVHDYAIYMLNKRWRCYLRPEGIKVELDFVQELPLIPKKIKQVILNLCKNAVEAILDGGILSKGYQKARGFWKRSILDGDSKRLEVFQLFEALNRPGITDRRADSSGTS
jgi:hypothetical protein